MAQKQPNIILIMTDEMRGDCMGFAGHPDVKTPYLDTLAAKGVSFPNAYSACPTCVPARAVLHTGLSQRHTGRVGYQDGVAWDYACTMAGELAKQGYYTQCVGKMHVHPLRSMMGFHHIELHDGYLHEYRYPDVPGYEQQAIADDYYYWLKDQKGIACDPADTGLDCNGWTARPWPHDEALHPTNWAVTRSIDFLRRRDRRMPFFLMLSFVRPHAPYDAPKAFFDLYENELRAPVYGDWNRRDLLQKYGRIYNNLTGPQDPQLIARQQQGYYACISHVDNQIGRFLGALTEQKLMDDTVILFTSDHGEMLSDHCFCRKSLPYQGSVHIPMVLSGPAHLVPQQGETDASLVELRDVMPTLLDFAGAPQNPALDGESLRGGTARTFLHGEHTLAWEQMSSQFIITARDKYIWFSQTGEEQYFDLEIDPRETHNAIHDARYAARIDTLRAQLAAQLDGCEEGYSKNGKLVVGCKPFNCLQQR